MALKTTWWHPDNLARRRPYLDSRRDILGTRPGVSIVGDRFVF